MTEEELKAQEAAKAAEELKAKSAADAAAAEAARAEASKIEELPQWAQDLIRSTRREAASHRTTANEFKEKFGASEDAAGKLAAAEKLIAEHKAAEEQAHLALAAEKLGIPADAVALLNPSASGEDRLKALAAIAAGSGPNVIVDNALHARRSATSAPSTNGAELMQTLLKSRR